MDIEPVALLDLHGQAVQEGARVDIERGKGPVEGGAGIIIHALGQAARGSLIMIALNGERALLHLGTHPIDYIGGICPIADQIAKKDQPLGLLPRRMGEAGFKRLAIAVYVRKKSDAHRVRAVSPSGQSSLFLRSGDLAQRRIGGKKKGLGNPVWPCPRPETVCTRLARQAGSGSNLIATPFMQ